MAKTFKHYKNPWVLVLLLLVGALAGDAIAAVMPGISFLKPFTSLGFQPATLNLHFFKLTFGFTMDFGLLTVLGLLFGYLLYHRM